MQQRNRHGKASAGYVDSILKAVVPSPLPETEAAIPVEPRPPVTGGPAAPKRRGVLVESLTERELDVLRLMAEGLKYQEMADRLFISLNTVRFYVKAVYGKLGVDNRVKALTVAREHGLI
jgi:LuxR family maltose regulon positive regulatory protein